MLDSHAHLCHSAFAEDRTEVLARAHAAGVTTLINIATHPDELEQGLILAHQYPWVHQAAATTPHDAEQEGELHFECFAQHAQAGHLVAIGETGLDYHRWRHSARAQHALFRRYLQLAHTCALPVIVHCRDAFEDLFRILDDEHPICGVVHCFTGTTQEAEEVLARGWYLSLSGALTFKNSAPLRETVRHIPLNRLLIETDAPYLAPGAHRGQRNEPAYLVETATCLAQILGIETQEVAAATRANAHALFSLDPSRQAGSS